MNTDKLVASFERVLRMVDAIGKFAGGLEQPYESEALKALYNHTCDDVLILQEHINALIQPPA